MTCVTKGGRVLRLWDGGPVAALVVRRKRQRRVIVGRGGLPKAAGETPILAIDRPVHAAGAPIRPVDSPAPAVENLTRLVVRRPLPGR